MKPLDLIATAEILLASNTRRPTQASLCRAVSAAYYGVFHSLARSCADVFIGGTNAGRGTIAWRRTYRALDHGQAKTQCRSVRVAGTPIAIQDFANMFVTLQELRHSADYDPFKRFTKSVVQALVAEARVSIQDFERCSPTDRRAFASHVLFKERK